MGNSISVYARDRTKIGSAVINPGGLVMGCFDCERLFFTVRDERDIPIYRLGTTGRDWYGDGYRPRIEDMSGNLLIKIDTHWGSLSRFGTGSDGGKISNEQIKKPHTFN